jgi:hypothetical protein
LGYWVIVRRMLLVVAWSVVRLDVVLEVGGWVFSKMESRRNGFVGIRWRSLKAVEGHASLLLGRFTGVLTAGEVRGER